ncbi:MAG TPA: phosphatase domain-containing protein, partial [Candidatus Obscuribacterales bacterium]
IARREHHRHRVHAVGNILDAFQDGREQALIVGLDFLQMLAQLVVKGRLYSKRRVDEVEEDDSRLRNLVNTSKRFITNEAEQVWVQVQLREHLQEVQTDDEGLFTAVLEGIKDIPYGVHAVTVVLSPRNRKRMQAEPGIGNFILHPADSNRVSIISDIDDTILLTEATSKVRLLRNVFLSNYKTQSAVEGMSDIYRAIHYGPEGDGYDATHYVSSSPDNLYSRINMFLDYRKFPSGSIDLKNIGLRKGSDSLFEHEKYKLGRIQRIIETYPQRRFVLFGDSGEHDPEIYRKLARDYPEQIVAIYIHNVTGADPYSSRFEGQMVFTSIDKVRRDLLKRGLVYAD